MQLNVLDDLAEAMKALDGKKRFGETKAVHSEKYQHFSSLQRNVVNHDVDKARVVANSSRIPKLAVNALFFRHCLWPLRGFESIVTMSLFSTDLHSV